MRRRYSSRGENDRVDMRVCCWTTARRSIVRRGMVGPRCTPPRERPRRHGASVAGQRRGGQCCSVGWSDPLYAACENGVMGAAVAGQRRGGRPGSIRMEYKGQRSTSRLPGGPHRRGATVADKGAEVDRTRRSSDAWTSQTPGPLGHPSPSSRSTGSDAAPAPGGGDSTVVRRRERRGTGATATDDAADLGAR